MCVRTCMVVGCVMYGVYGVYGLYGQGTHKPKRSTPASKKSAILGCEANFLRLSWQSDVLPHNGDNSHLHVRKYLRVTLKLRCCTLLPLGQYCCFSYSCSVQPGNNLHSRGQRERERERQHLLHTCGHMGVSPELVLDDSRHTAPIPYFDHLWLLRYRRRDVAMPSLSAPDEPDERGVSSGFVNLYGIDI
ncbi:hypothetical protein V8C37DRAFT_219405 [Trichoderma ceciliae]